MCSRTQKIFSLLQNVSTSFVTSSETQEPSNDVVTSSLGDLNGEPIASTSYTINDCNQSDEVPVGRKRTERTDYGDLDVSDYSDVDPDFNEDDSNPESDSEDNEEAAPVLTANNHSAKVDGLPDPGTVKRRRNNRRQPDSWKRNIRKKFRNLGQEYTSIKGTIKSAKQIKPPCNNCTLKCHTLLNEEARVAIFEDFWKLESVDIKRTFICKNVIRSQSKTSRKENSRRKCSQTYTLSYQEKSYKVCKKFFLGTLSISEKFLRIAISKCNRSIIGMPSPDKRGKRVSVNKFPEEVRAVVEAHIDAFPRMPGHWCRKDSTKEYLEAILNKQKMYDLYVEHCAELKVEPVGQTFYREVLISKNIAFYTPRKDQCWCHDYDMRNENEKLDGRDEYLLHQRRKNAANESKQFDKVLAKGNTDVVTANFDLEAVLYSPLFHAKPLFYKRKLALYNLTVYEVAKNQGHCFMWDEVNGGRGSNEIATCVNKFILGLPQTTKKLILYSDSCLGQNKNAIVACMLMQTLNDHPTLESIEMKYLEPGHTHMECDSMHATIERASEYAKIVWPNDWQTVITLAKRRGPRYTVNRLTFNDFNDYMLMKDTTMTNKSKAVDNSILNWKEVKCLLFKKEKPTSLFFKMEYWNEYKELQTNTKRGRPRNDIYELTKAYNGLLPISGLKYKNLMELCADKTIPVEYHTFYKDLPYKPENKKKKHKRPQTSQHSESNNSSEDDTISLQVMRAKTAKRKLCRN